MESRIIKILIVFLSLFVFSSCDIFEFRGFFIAYESADERFEQSMSWNEKNPYKEISVPEDDYILYVMADTHVGGTKNLELFLNEAIVSEAVAAVMAGDLTTGHAEDLELFGTFMPDENDLPVFKMVGNHDLYFDGWKTYYKLFGSSTYYFTVKTPVATDLYICLDSGSGTFGAKQIKWLEELLEDKRDNYRKCVLFTHNNLFRIRRTTSTNPNPEEIIVLMELCIKHNIDMIITGHDHRRNTVKSGNTKHVTVDALLDDYKHAGYLIMKIVKGEIDLEFINI